MEQVKQATILVVDDDEFTLNLLKKMLTVEGYAVCGATSGEDALASVAEQLPDLILLDVMMPGIDGFEVTRRLKADPRSRSVPIILVTSLEDFNSCLKGLEAGAEEFVSKPVGISDLQMRVKYLLKVKDDQLPRDGIFRTTNSRAVASWCHWGWLTRACCWSGFIPYNPFVFIDRNFVF